MNLSEFIDKLEKAVQDSGEKFFVNCAAEYGGEIRVDIGIGPCCPIEFLAAHLKVMDEILVYNNPRDAASALKLEGPAEGIILRAADWMALPYIEDYGMGGVSGSDEFPDPYDVGMARDRILKAVGLPDAA